MRNHLGVTHRAAAQDWPEAKTGPEASAQYGGLSQRKHERRLVGESFTLSLNDNAILFRFFGAIDYLERCFTLHLTCRKMTLLAANFPTASSGSEYRSSSLPRRNMKTVPGPEDAVQHAGGRRWIAEQVLDLVELKAAILQLRRTAFRNIVHRRADVAQRFKLLIDAADLGQCAACRLQWACCRSNGGATAIRRARTLPRL